MDAVRLWARGESATPNWWSQKKEDDRRTALGGANNPVPFNMEIGEFNGQGRRLGYNGFAYAVLGSVYQGSGDQTKMRPLASVTAGRAQSMAVRAKGRLTTERLRPGSWWLLAFTSLALVWLDIGMALIMTYNTPTVGLSCRSGVYILYGLLSTLTWLVRVFPASNYPRDWLKILCHCVNAFATVILFFTVFAAVSWTIFFSVIIIPELTRADYLPQWRSLAVFTRTASVRLASAVTWTLKVLAFIATQIILMSRRGGRGAR